jgi:hypothetical protein
MTIKTIPINRMYTASTVRRFPTYNHLAPELIIALLTFFSPPSISPYNPLASISPPNSTAARREPGDFEACRQVLEARRKAE